MRLKLLLRSFILFLLLLIAALTGLSFLPGPILGRLVYWWVSSPPAPTPPPPIIDAPRGSLPVGPVGLEEWAQFAGNSYGRVGSGFLLRLQDGVIVGVTTAHSLGQLGNPSRPLEKIAFAALGREGYVAESDTFYGEPGAPRAGDDMTVDWVLVKLNADVDPNLVLTPDARGGPQPGERLILYSGRGDGEIVGGTVQSADPKAVWVLMDLVDYPADAVSGTPFGGMSGSPLISEHTGQVVGMAIATTPRQDRFMVILHPISSLVAKAEAAQEFLKMSEFRR